MSALAKSNYFKRWSHRLRWPKQLCHPTINVGLEGCGTGFNATNAIRSCLFFGTPPPQFLRANNFDDIFKLEADKGDGTNNEFCSSFDANSESMTARFGPEFHNPELPVVALENFVDKARPLDEVVPILPEAFNLVVGHENDGVAQKWLDQAEYVTYIPQYGTISSVNLVSALGVFLHNVVRQRQLHPADTAQGQLFSSVLPLQDTKKPIIDSDNFVRVFEKPLPKSPLDGGRLEPRPIHPHFYGLNVNQIQDAYRALAASVLPDASAVPPADPSQAFSRKLDKGAPVGLPDAAAPEMSSKKFRVGILFENYEDTRNLGGMIRLANAFLAPVFYLGRRKINRRGAVGTENFTPITFLGPGRWSGEQSKPWEEDTTKNRKKCLGSGCNEDEPDSVLQNLLQAEITEQRRMAMWWLDCGQSSLWAPSDSHRVENKDLSEVSLTWSSEKLHECLQLVRAEHPGGIILCIPQEGMAPGVDILERCTHRVHLGSQPVDAAHRGMPSQVAAGIALQRLLHSMLTESI